MVWFDRPELVILPDITLNFFNCPFNILFKFQILMQGRYRTHLALKLIWVFKICESIIWLIPFLYWLTFFRGFLWPFYYWLDENTGILPQLSKTWWALFWGLKSELWSLVAFEKLHEHIRTLFKKERGSLAFFENSNEVQKLNAYPA